MKKTGYILLVVGATITILTAFNFTFFTRENIVDAGNLQINTRKKHSLPWSPFVGVALMVAGAGAYLIASNRSFKR